MSKSSFDEKIFDSVVIPDYYYHDGIRLMDEGRCGDAIKQYKKALAFLIHYKTLERIGKCYESLGDLHHAIIYLAASTALNASFSAPTSLMKILEQSDQSELAEVIAKICIGRDPNHKFSKAILEKNTIRRCHLYE